MHVEDVATVLNITSAHLSHYGAWLEVLHLMELSKAAGALLITLIAAERAPATCLGDVLHSSQLMKNARAASGFGQSFICSQNGGKSPSSS